MGIALVILALYCASLHLGWEMIALLYLQPYMWVNHWIVAITYLYHTHPDVPKYEDGAWSFIKRVTATAEKE